MTITKKAEKNAEEVMERREAIKAGIDLLRIEPIIIGIQNLFGEVFTENGISQYVKEVTVLHIQGKIEIIVNFSELREKSLFPDNMEEYEKKMADLCVKVNCNEFAYIRSIIGKQFHVKSIQNGKMDFSVKIKKKKNN